MYTKENPLTIEALNKMEPGIVFCTGMAVNSPDDIYMVDSNIGKGLKWLAKRGGINDWAIYIHWENYSYEWIRDHGDKVSSEYNIRKLVPCTDEAFQNYRY